MLNFTIGCIAGSGIGAYKAKDLEPLKECVEDTLELCCQKTVHKAAPHIKTAASKAANHPAFQKTTYKVREVAVRQSGNQSTEQKNLIEAKRAEQAAELKVFFEPRTRVGIDADWQIGTVTFVDEVHQAHQLGVRVGMRLSTVAGKPYTKDRYDTAKISHHRFKVTFAQVLGSQAPQIGVQDACKDAGARVADKTMEMNKAAAAKTGTLKAQVREVAVRQEGTVPKQTDLPNVGETSPQISAAASSSQSTEQKRVGLLHRLRWMFRLSIVALCVALQMEFGSSLSIEDIGNGLRFGGLSEDAVGPVVDLLSGAVVLWETAKVEAKAHWTSFADAVYPLPQPNGTSLHRAVVLWETAKVEAKAHWTSLADAVYPLPQPNGTSRSESLIVSSGEGSGDVGDGEVLASWPSSTISAAIASSKDNPLPPQHNQLKMPSHVIAGVSVLCVVVYSVRFLNSNLSGV